MRKTTALVIGASFLISMSSVGLLGQTRQRPSAQVQRPSPPISRDRREDIRDRREDVRDRREDIRDRREDVLDRREDIRDAKTDGGRADRLEDIRDRREDVRDRREDVRDRREDVRDRFEDVIDHNPRFRQRVHELLPPGVKPGEAISGFKNQGQFLSALHASKNLNIPFADLKTKLMSSDDMTLGKAIHELRPDFSENDIRQGIHKSEQDASESEKVAQS